jgi:polyisoprenoid-binding protein YceI
LHLTEFSQAVALISGERTGDCMSTNEPASVRYKVDAGQSKFTVQAFASGLLAGFGHNPTIAIRDFTGEAEFSPDSLANAGLRLVIKTNSLTLLDEVKEKDREEIERTMLNDILETRRYPEIIFQSTSISLTKILEGRYKARIIGDVTLRDITRNGLWIQAKIILSGDDLQAQGEFILKQTDFQIKPVSFAAGALKLKDELKFVFELLAYREHNALTTT